MNKDKVVVGCKITGECASIQSFTGYSIKALKNWMSSHKKHWEDESDLYVIEGSTWIKMYFQDHINRINRDPYPSGFNVVGVASQRIIDLCMFYKKIRPLHICQEIAFNIANTESAIKQGDQEWAEELQSERVKFYKEAKQDYNLNMTKVNDLTWEEFDHVINNYKFI